MSALLTFPAATTARADATEIAKAVRPALRRAFRGAQFSVRISRFSMGESVTVSWTDGPTAPEVDAVLAAAGLQAWSDGRMRFLHTSRHHSPAHVARAAERARYEPSSDYPADVVAYQIARRMRGDGVLVTVKAGR